MREFILVKLREPYETSTPGVVAEYQPFYKSTGKNSEEQLGNYAAGTWLPFDGFTKKNYIEEQDLL